MAKDYYKSGKWFYPLQAETSKLLASKYEEHSCNWQQVTKDIVTECYIVIPKPDDGKVKSILLVYYKNNMTVTVFEGGDFFTSISAIKNQEK